LLIGVPAPVIMSDFREISAHRREILGFKGCGVVNQSTNPRNSSAYFRAYIL